MSWTKFNTCHYFTPSSVHRKSLESGICHLAGFDLDGTLIMSDRGDKYAKSSTDWVFTTPHVVRILTEFYNNGWTIAIFSNRKGTPAMLRSAQSRVKKIFELLGFEVWCFFATGGAPYRKPDVGMVTLFASLNEVKHWGSESFYCGDAVGPTSSNPWYKWSDVDFVLAKSCGVKFYTPSERLGTFPSPTLDEKTNLIITQGQNMSGWEVYLPYVGKYIPLGSDRHFYVINDIKTQSMKGPDQDKKNVVVLVAGMHPNKASRDLVRSYYRATFNQDPVSNVYWFACTSQDEKYIDASYITKFESPSSEVHYRIN